MEKCKPPAKLQAFAFFELPDIPTRACNSLHSTRKLIGFPVPEFTKASARVYVSAGMMNFRYSRSNMLRPGTVAVLFLSLFLVSAYGQTNCGDSENPLDTDPPKGMSVQELTQKLIANEDKVQAARQHYTFTQDVLVQTLEGKAVEVDDLTAAAFTHAVIQDALERYSEHRRRGFMK